MSKKTTISLIAALARNRVIGRNQTLPWHLPADLKRFRQLTVGKPIIMGRKTFEAIGRPLPGRKNIVMTSDPSCRLENCQVAHSLEQALAAAGEAAEVMIIGGAQVYRQFLPRAGKMYLTLVGADFEGDAFFPEYDRRDWREVYREDHDADQENPCPYRFVILEKET